MPNYDYLCNGCNHTFERHLKMSDNKLPESEPCPKCNVTGSVIQTIANTKLGIVASRYTNHVVPDGFKEVIKGIKKESPRNTIDI